ncbi:MAG: DUF4296 domain-containing protein [Flavobacteriia bacterium]|jgi:hypothetical protein
MRLISIFILLLGCFSCTESMNGFQQPKDLVPRDTTVMILKEISLVESYVQNKYSHVAVFKELMKNSGNEILKKFHVSRVRFENSIDFYASQQELMRSIYSEVLDSLNVEASKISEEVLKESNSNPVHAPKLFGIPEHPSN